MNNEPVCATADRKAQAGSRKWGFVALCAGEDNNTGSQEVPMCIGLLLLPPPSHLQQWQC